MLKNVKNFDKDFNKLPDFSFERGFRNPVRTSILHNRCKSENNRFSGTHFNPRYFNSHVFRYQWFYLVLSPNQADSSWNQAEVGAIVAILYYYYLLYFTVVYLLQYKLPYARHYYRQCIQGTFASSRRICKVWVPDSQQINVEALNTNKNRFRLPIKPIFLYYYIKHSRLQQNDLPPLESSTNCPELKAL